MVSAIRCSDWCKARDSVFHRSTTSRKRAAAAPPHTDGGTVLICPMNVRSIAPVSSLRPSILPATVDIRPKSVFSAPLVIAISLPFAVVCMIGRTNR